MPPPVALGLRQRGIDVLAIQKTGMLGETDEALLEFCKREGRVIFTQDDDFLRLHANGVLHAGIVYTHQRTPVGTAVQGLTLIYQVLDATEMVNHIEFL